jgi:poly(3-hydroxybutyrate) depolymerase
MRTGWFGSVLKGGLVAVVAGISCAMSLGCSEHNDGNITAPPPPTVFTVPAPGSGGSGAQGSGGSGGGVLPVPTGDEPIRSTGCSMPKPATQVDTIPGNRTGYTEYTVNQTGATLGKDDPALAGPRQFFVRLPADYDENKPYRVVYIGQGCGAQKAGKTNTFAMFNEAQGGDEQAIYVGLSVPDNNANPGCYDNNSGVQSQEWEAFELIHGLVESKFCVDNNRIFVIGYSTGGWLSNMWGCYFGGANTPPLSQPDVDAGRTMRKFAPKWAIRGHASVTGSLPPNQPVPCNGPSAGFWLHDAGDKSNLIETNIAALNLQLKTNGCQGDYQNGPKKPWGPAQQIPGLEGEICQEYTGCPAEVSSRYPLVFCTTNGFGHRDQPDKAIPGGTAFFKLMDPAL